MFVGTGSPRFATVSRAQQCSAFADGPAVFVVAKVDVVKRPVVATFCFVQLAPASRVNRIVPPSPTIQPRLSLTKSI